MAKLEARRFHLPLLLIVLAIGLSGCVTLPDPEVAQEQHSQSIVTLRPGDIVGQTFIARRAGLNSVQIWLALAKPETSPIPGGVKGTLIAELYHSPTDSEPLVSHSFNLVDAASRDPLTISIPVQADSAGRDYYLALRLDNAGVDVLGRAEDAYPDGQAWLSGTPLEADFGFRVTYWYDSAALLADLGDWSSQLWLALPLAFCLWLPGRVLLGWSGLDQRLDPGERTGISLGLSLAIIPVVITWTSLAGLHWSPLYLWAVVILLAALLALRFLQASSANARQVARQDEQKLQSTAAPLASRLWPNLALTVIFLFSLGVRLTMSRDLAAPPWVDSVHHALITRMIVEQGAFPKTYAPYMEIETANYHPGFHSVLAVFHWLSSADYAHGMLVFGQVLNALAVVAVYLFAVTWTGSPWAGVAAGFIAGLLSPMPAYYTSWGRYTQLAGLLILPAAVRLIVMALPGWDETGPLQVDGPETAETSLRGFFSTHRAHLLLAALACAGLFLTHYRVIAFLGALLIVSLLGLWLRARRALAARHSLVTALAWLAVTALLAIGMVSPWLPGTFTTLFIPRLSWSQAPAAAWFSDWSWNYLTSALGYYAIALAGLGMVWGLVMRRLFPVTLALWVGLMLLLGNLAALRLPGAGFINNTSVEIALFIPMATLGGYPLAWALEAWDRILPRSIKLTYRLGILAGTTWLAFYAAIQLLPILNPVTMIFRQADRPALDWIAENIPPGEPILISSTPWGYNLYAGNDGGFWIAPLAQHPTIPPPVLYGLGNNPEKAAAINEICQQVNEKAAQPVELHDYLSAQGIHYIYLGRRGGKFSPALLQTSGLFKTIYSGQGTWVFELVGES